MHPPLLVSIVGPTAVGKTALAIDLAKSFDSIIVSSDSRQFYREMDIGTAKPSKEQLEAVPHYFVDHLSVHELYSVGDFERDVLALLATYFQSHSLAFMVGGSGLYINAVLKGLDDMPQVPEELRQAIMEEASLKGLGPLLEELSQRDPAYYALVDKHNTQRVVRAVEVIRHTGKPMSSFWKKDAKKRPFDVLQIGITDDRDRLYATINRRVDLMMEQGLLEEVKKLYAERHLYALQTVGYQELFDALDGKHTVEHAVELIKRNTRRFAKRQWTWFRRDPAVKWFGNQELESIKDYLNQQIALRS